jgi:hypothetical protein
MGTLTACGTILVCVWKFGVAPRSHKPIPNPFTCPKSRTHPSMTTPAPPRPMK